MTERKDGAEPLCVFPSCGRIGAGESGDAAGTVQMILNALKVRYDCYDFLDLNFTLDEPTARAISAFRAAHDIPDAPGIDAKTWNALASEYAVLREAE